MDFKELNTYIMNMYDKVSNKCNNGESIEKLNQYERVFFITQLLETEVNSGGFSGFFYNSSGNFSNEIIGAFLSIKAKKTAKICKKALKVYKNKLPINYEERIKFIDNLENKKTEAKLKKCDDKFYNYDDNLNQLNHNYIIRNYEYFK